MRNYIKTLMLIALSSGLILGVNSCKKDNKLPILTTEFISDITQNSAVSGGNVIDIGSTPIISRGICWNTSEILSITNCDKTVESGDLGPFVSTMTSLVAGTTYYVSAYAINESGTAYGEIMAFTTNPATGAAVTTTEITSITPTTAVSGGNISSDGGVSVTARGVCWATSINPTTSNNKTNDGTGTGTFTSNIAGLIPGTLYHVRAYATNSVETSYGADVQFVTPGTPTVTTMKVSAITLNTASTGGNVTANGGATVTARGICWNTSPNPTIANSKTTNGTGIGLFTSSLTGLAENTTYYVRAYATNEAGTSYGNQIFFCTNLQDIDHNIYTTVTIGNQIWIVENLKTTKYSDGQSIPLVTGQTQWYNLTSSPGFCWLDNDQASYGNIYGALYNWYAVNTGKLCPTGWHIPTHAEWITMQDYLIANGYNYDGTLTGNKIAKSLAATTNWSPNTHLGAPGNTDYPEKKNITGFTAFPGGERNYTGQFSIVGYMGYWWSSSEQNTYDAYCWFITWTESNLGNYGAYKRNATSVRCVKD